VQDGDPRDRTVDTFGSRYKVDRSQAKRVEATASQLFEQANETWGHDAEAGLRYLGWASRVHEIGLSISFTGHHKHGAYILEHAEMPGFSLDDQAMLAAIVGGHRRKLSREAFAQLGAAQRKLALHLSVVLRIAASLHRSRSEEALPELGLDVGRSRMRLLFPDGWLDERPLSRVDLEEQAAHLGRVGIDLELEIETG
jgi:exopolyphosphatase/guanosine-5'-triphosphate,3'-diphosphate pyrophosphatase